jgi:hypothetical protein
MVRFRFLLPLSLLLTACTVALREAAPTTTPDRPLDPSVAAPPEMAPEVPKPAQAEPPFPKPAPKTVKPRPSAPLPKEGEPPVPADLAQQPIEELVIRPDDLTGYWVLVAPRIVDVDVGLFSGVHIRYGGEMGRRNICWLEQSGRSVSALCASGTVLKSGSGSVDAEGVSMRWWMGAATANFSGKFSGQGKITGGFSGGIVGVSVTGDVPASLYRLDPSDLPPDPDRPSAALIRQVWLDVRQGRLTEGRYEGSAPKRVDQGMPKEIAAETPESLLYLGRIVVRWRKEQRETLQDVYQVMTESGRRLCRVAPNGKGQVIDFACQAVDRKKN